MDTDHPTPPPDPTPRPRIGWAIACLILGLLSVFSSFLLVGVLLGGLAIVCGLVHISGRRGPNTLAWVGTVLALLGVVLSAGFGLLYVKGWQMARQGWTNAVAEVTVESERVSLEFDEWIGREAPDFTLTSLEGEPFTMSSLRGRRVVLDFWATWCSPCRREVPHFIRLTDEHPEEELVIIGISDEEEELLLEFVEENGVNYTIVMAGELPAPFDSVLVIPTTFFIDRNGIIQSVLEGYHDYDQLKEYAVTADHQEPTD